MVERIKPALFGVLTACLVLGAIEAIGWAALQSRPELQRLRELLRDVPGAMPTHLPTSYLRYASRPEIWDPEHGATNNNALGYRGPPVDFEPTDDVVRILFLGGSTTYGSGTGDAREAYPAQVGALLLESGHQVEVMNGGLEGASSAELLTHYLFRYRYFKPDVLVVSTGLNDTPASENARYQPDYSHMRAPLRVPRPVPTAVRPLLRSHFVSFVLGSLLYSEELNGVARDQPVSPQTRWFPLRRYQPAPASRGDDLGDGWTVVEVTRDDAQAFVFVVDKDGEREELELLRHPDGGVTWSPGPAPPIAVKDTVDQLLKATDDEAIRRRVHALDDADLAFRRNVETLVREARADGATVLLMPSRPRVPYRPQFQAWLARHADTLAEIAAEQDGAHFASLPLAEICSHDAHWADDQHLTAAGNALKAAYVAPLLADVLRTVDR